VTDLATADLAAAELAAALARELEGEVAFDDYTRHLYSRDASMYSITPRGVVSPRHATDVARAVKLAGEHGSRCCPGARAPAWPVRPWATRWCWTSPGNMSQILELEPGDPHGAGAARRGAGPAQPGRLGARADVRPDTSTSNRATLAG